MRTLPLKPNHKRVAAYHASLAEFAKLGVKHETAVRAAFQALLEDCTSLVNKGRADKWKLVPEYSLKTKAGAKITPDGAIATSFPGIIHGWWEAKDSADDLDQEVAKKLKAGYPRDNILFQSPTRAVLVQDGRRVLDLDLAKPENLVDVLRGLFEYAAPAHDQWEKAVAEFKDRLPEIGREMTRLVRAEYKTNKAYAEAFDTFVALCQQALNPNLAVAAVEEMLIQHILTERIFRKIFDVGEFMQKNNIASEIEKVAAALTSRSFSRDKFLHELNRFYVAIEDAAGTIPDFSEKQKFLNTVYEQFFQGFAVERADTLGIVYTPQEIVDFMLASVEEILKSEFNRSLGDPGVHVIDPFVGTGNFMVNLIRRLPKTRLEHKYRHELHCNEVMLLPYYVAAMNIEHTFYEQIGRYEAFPGICLVDTFETAEKAQVEFGFFNPENSERVKRQKAAPIFVVMGNPPYNAGQVNESDNNKNRTYATIDERVRHTYVADSKATLRRKLSDPYVKAFRWASDRLKDEGIVAFVSNNSFVDDISFDGMRKHLEKDFSAIYVLDLKGNVRKDSMREGIPIGEANTIFGLGAMVGVSVCFLVRKAKSDSCVIRYAEVDWKATREEKFALLERCEDVSKVEWRTIDPDQNFTWLREGLANDFNSLMPLGAKGGNSDERIFRSHSLGVSTNRDAVVYGFDSEVVSSRVEGFCETFTAEVQRYQQKGAPKDVDGFVEYEKLKWSRNLKRHLRQMKTFKFDASHLRTCLYRPFTALHLYAAPIAVDELGQMLSFFPSQESEDENRVICVSDVGLRSPFSAIATNRITDLHLCASTDAFQCFPFYTYDGEDGARRENIPLSTLVRFQNHYGDEAITKWDIFHYVYAVLHHPEYRTRYAANLRRELPRIPLVGVQASACGKTEEKKTKHSLKAGLQLFRTYAANGQKLADLHVHYEQAAEHPLQRIENPDEPLNWRVEKMRLTRDKTALVYNDFLTLAGIPEAAFAYRLGNRSALEWVIDQYQTSTDPRSGITNDPNREDEPDYIVKLIGKVITVSLETQQLVGGLPPLDLT